jgi:hypothetical protein
MRYNNSHSIRQDKNQAAYEAVMRDIRREQAVVKAAEDKLMDLRKKRSEIRNDMTFEDAAATF